MRKERFPKQRKYKFQPRGDMPSQVMEMINDNAYKIDLPSKYVVSTTFNVVDLTPFVVGDDDFKDLRKIVSQEGRNDEDIAQGPKQGLGGPMTRARKAEKTLKQVVATILEVAPAVKDIKPNLFQCMIIIKDQ